MRSRSVSIFPSGLFLNGLNADEVEAILDTGIMRKVPRKTMLINQGDEAHSLFFIVTGRVKVFRTTKEGEEVVTRLLDPGETVLEHVVFYGKVSPVHAQTETDAELVVFSVESLMQLVQTYPAFGLNMMQILATRTNEMMHLVEQISVRPAIERVAGFLLQIMLENGQECEEFQIPYEKALIARHLGINQATLSRCFHALACRGITVKGRTVRLTHKFALCQFADPIYAHKCKNCGSPACHLSRR